MIDADLIELWHGVRAPKEKYWWWRLRRLLSVGADPLSAVVQGLLAVLIGGALIQYACQIVETATDVRTHYLKSYPA